jgi:hypothetical protein
LGGTDVRLMAEIFMFRRVEMVAKLGGIIEE